MAVMKLDFLAGDQNGSMLRTARPTLLKDADPDTGAKGLLAYWHAIAGDGLDGAQVRLMHFDGAEIVPESFVVDKARVSHTARFPEHVSAMLGSRIDSQ